MATKKEPTKKATTTASKPAVKKWEPASCSGKNTTGLSARVDLGFGNKLFIRGDGPGLSWNCGVQMENKGPDVWAWCTNEAKGDVVCKVLANDDTWAGGDNIVIKAGEKKVIYPTF